MRQAVGLSSKVQRIAAKETSYTMENECQVNLETKENQKCSVLSSIYNVQQTAENSVFSTFKKQRSPVKWNNSPKVDSPRLSTECLSQTKRHKKSPS